MQAPMNRIAQLLPYRRARWHTALLGTLALTCLALSPWAAAQSLARTQAPLHDAWSQLLKQCVTPTADGSSTAAHYDCFQRQQGALQSYLNDLAAIDATRYAGWAKNQQLAFLINAYNAATVALILTEYPDLTSIRDLGSLLRSPWKRSFVSLLGEELSLDEIEHGMIRAPGHFEEPRIHFAVNCASISCPSLRREAYAANRLEEQLQAQTEQFLGDNTRNRARKGDLELSSLFKWYREDFEAGWRGARSLEAFVLLYADALELKDGDRQRLASGEMDIRFLDYDWNLNVAKKTAKR
ncbi:MAG: hypothetical protein ACI87W_002895 [Halieaceae bacterium]|jgi:hypothetical protein